MHDEGKRRTRDDQKGKAEVNPAARHDRPKSPEREQGDSQPTPQVDPAQEEPLDPLGPGGIGG